MNKLTKVGCSALCGSLAAISAANAGDLAVTGSAHVTYMSNSGNTTGNPFGMASAVTFKGSGELDNGWGWNFTIDETDTVAFSAARVDITMGGLGTIEFDQGNSGNGIAAYDNVLPTAWEEAHGAGLSGGVKTVVGSGSSDNIQYTTPTVLGTTIALTYAHDIGSSDTADKSTGNSNDLTGRGYDATVKINPSLGTEILSGLNLYAGASTIELYQGANERDRYEGVGAVTYALGPVEVGAMWSGLYTGVETAAEYHTYKNHGFGIAFNVNDDLSISYGEYQSRKAGYESQAAQEGEDMRVVEVTSWQAAYTMGGASFRIADVKADNVLWNNVADESATIISMGLAF
ncbi:porin [Pelagibacteraceae bacterium]|nr:porin [Pelagibacteraceae bacterium]